MGRILYLVPGTGLLENNKAARATELSSFLTNPGNHSVRAECVGYGLEHVRSSVESEYGIKGILEYAVKHRGEYDAVIVGSILDPGIFSLREISFVPVVAQLEASAALCGILGEKFAVITDDRASGKCVRALVRKYGLAGRCLDAVFTVDTAAEDILSGLKEKIEFAADMGADSVIIGCGCGLAAQQRAELKKCSIPVVFPDEASVKAAEMMLDLNIRHSDASFPKPELARIEELLY